MKKNHWSLPVFITAENKTAVGVGMWLLAIAMYLTSNHFHWFTPRLLPMSWIDNAVPFLPNTFWLYVSEYFLFGFTYFFCRNLTNATTYFYSFLFLQFISNLIFWLWPTTYPRELFPLPEDLNSLTYYWFNSLRTTDSPASCCPSLHVSSCYLSSMIFLRESRSKFVFCFLWASAVAVSTLTTKQHYFIDIVAGLGMAIAVYWIFAKLIKYSQVTTQNGSTSLQTEQTAE